MMKYEEDEIQVLGSSNKPPQYRMLEKNSNNNGNNPLIWGIVCIVVSCILLFILGWWNNQREIEEEQLPLEEVEIENKIEMPEQENKGISQVVYSKDSINDVPLHIYHLDNLKAELTLQKPSTDDATVYFVLQAADVRRDKKGIVGDYVVKGEQIANGKRKTGFCSILNGQIILGNSLTDEAKEYSISQKGDFFRQYPLVMDGEIQENRLKGKAVRRALTQLGDEFYIVISENRESLYDFSEALSDIGFTHALYLVGGEAIGWWRENDTTIHLLTDEKEDTRYPGLNYLVFKNTL